MVSTEFFNFIAPQQHARMHAAQALQRLSSMYGASSLSIWTMALVLQTLMAWHGEQTWHSSQFNTGISIQQLHFTPVKSNQNFYYNLSI